jgi:hypothetical protein
MDSAAVSFRTQPYECDYQQITVLDKPKPIVKTPYITNQYVPNVAAAVEREK